MSSTYNQSIGLTCYERDEQFCEDPQCLRLGCKLINAKKDARHIDRTDEEASKRPSERLSVEQIERAAQVMRDNVTQGNRPRWEKIDGRARAKWRDWVCAVVDSIGEIK